MSMRFWFGVLALLAATTVGAQEYPVKPVHMVTPWPPGGGADVIARIVAAKLAEAWGQQVVVENKAGATGMIGTAAVARSAPDGYTLLLGTSATHAIAPGLYSKMPYDSEKDITPVILVAAVPHVIAVHPSLPVRTLAEFVALAKSRPGQLSFASSGSGSTPHVAGELFKTVAGVNLLHVPYKGTGQSLQDTLGGNVHTSFDTLPSLINHVKGGRLRGLAVTSKKRVASLPDLPTVAEAGAPGAEAVSWYGLFAPAGLPLPLVRKLHADMTRVLRLPDVVARFESFGTDETGSASPEAFAAMVKDEVAKYRRVSKAAGLKLD